MNQLRPGKLSVRALNQYRRRDVIAYLGLRYYLHNSSARSDQWIKRVAPQLVMSRQGAAYFRVNHFKEHDLGKVKHRPLFLPGANEALSETALLDECAKLAKFGNHKSVFSYPLALADSRYGTFDHYSHGLRARHEGIAAACGEVPSGVVRYLDLKRFYPSIKVDVAIRVWKYFSEEAGLSSEFRDLGERLILDHGSVDRSDEQNALLTGPMFSHLLANLVLREFDEEMAEKLPGRYFRYVDDITIVGESKAVADSIEHIRRRLGDMGFKLHGDGYPKNFEVAVGAWLKGRDDFKQTKREFSWMALIGGLKDFLLLNPAERNSIQTAFRAEGFRIPVIDYSAAVHERDGLERIRNHIGKAWRRHQMRGISANTLIAHAVGLRQQCEADLNKFLGQKSVSGFDRKRLIPRLRYLSGQVAYLASAKSLLNIAQGMAAYHEMDLQAGVLKAVGTEKLDEVLPLGTNAAQAAAQPLRAAGSKCTIGAGPLDEASEQSLAVFMLNGVNIDNPNKSASSELIGFAAGGANAGMMKSADPFVRELACLHGISENARHPAMLESIFDEDERLAMDTVEQLQESTSQ